MSDQDTLGNRRGPSTALTLHESDAATMRVPHNMPFVAQLIANAQDAPTPYRRRKSDRTGPLRAYAALDAISRSGTRRIV